MDLIINLNKPRGITSQEAVTLAKKMAGAKKAGHAGTLDPLATGVLLVCINEATKVTRFLSGLDKEYTARIKLGERTDTFDSEGQVIRKIEGFSFERREAEEVLKRFEGVIEQTPPMYSAVKMSGTPLYKLARKGITVERSPRLVTIHKIELTEFSLPLMEIRVSCSKGTYVRTLCDDIGEELGSGGHITELQRTRTGDFSIRDALTFDDIEGLAGKKAFAGNETISGAGGCLPDKSVWTIDAALRHITEYRMSEKEFSKARNGLPAECPDPSSAADGYLRLKDPSGRLFAMGMKRGNLIRVERMFHTGGSL